MNIYVCVGSSCHLRGSYEIINMMKDNIEKYSLADRVNLSAAFCLGKCTDGVSIKVGEEIICGVNPDNFQQVFDENILKKVK
jgi:NADH-quinone oxidoreductase subunit G